MTFVGGRFVFSFNQLGTNCGLIAPHAAIDYDGVAYLMGDNNFYAYDGRVNNLPCTVLFILPLALVLYPNND